MKRTQNASAVVSACGVYSNAISNWRPGPMMPWRVRHLMGAWTDAEATPLGSQLKLYLRPRAQGGWGPSMSTQRSMGHAVHVDVSIWSCNNHTTDQPPYRFTNRGTLSLALALTPRAGVQACPDEQRYAHSPDARGVEDHEALHVPQVDA